MPESKPYGGQNNPFLGAFFTDPSRRSHYLSTLHAQANRRTKRSPKSTLFPSLESLQITTRSIFGSPSPAPPPNQLSVQGPQTLLSRGTQHLPVINCVPFRCQPLAFRIRLLGKKQRLGVSHLRMPLGQQQLPNQGLQTPSGTVQQNPLRIS